MRKAIEIAGIVQGVGFRPYIYRLATEGRLAGFITNTEAGVSIEVEGSPEAVDAFLARLPKEVPPLARITRIVTADIASDYHSGFRILPSRAGAARRVLISPDVAICDDCRRELLDPTDRRFLYPFINCTNCGPRYTIVRDIPYDRALTSMAVFPMCAECQREYDDPRDRRFHAQPNACWNCGPRVELWDGAGGRIESPDPIAKAVELLAAGEIVAVKGLGGFHLAVDAMNEAAIARLRQGKRRVEKPFAIMAPDLESLEDCCWLDEASCSLLESPAHPIVLVEKKQPQRLAPSLAPFNRDLGVFLPYTPLHHLLFREKRFRALVMTSGNISEEPIAIDNAEAVERLGGIADYFLVHNREILLRADDSVMRVESGRPRVVRRSRGYVPAPVFLKDDLPLVLAVGGELKNTICLTRGREAFLSQHIGDLENLESYKFFESTVAGLKRILEIEPQLLAYDLHPDYFATRWALEQAGIRRVGVQHHHAHIASCMAENHLEGTVIGLALDGTGYGLDGNIWGGEVLVAGYGEFQRFAHLDYVPMPGGAAAITEPRRMAISYLFHHFGGNLWNLDIPFTRRLDHRRTETVLRMIERGINSPLTSSTGRLFDAVAAMCRIRENVNYEAQAAIELEAALTWVAPLTDVTPSPPAPPSQGGEGRVYSYRPPTSAGATTNSDIDRRAQEGDGGNSWDSYPRPLGGEGEPPPALSPGQSGQGEGSRRRPVMPSSGEEGADDASYPFALRPGSGGWIIDTLPLFSALVEDLHDDVPVGVVSRRFHSGFVDVLVRAAEMASEQTGLDRVCLSGGSFQNSYLLEHTRSRLEAAGFQVFTHAEVPCGDGGISLGQAMIAAHTHNGL
jgi:hydrogenase maturation protein HypF